MAPRSQPRSQAEFGIAQVFERQAKGPPERQDLLKLALNHHLNVFNGKKHYNTSRPTKWPIPCGRGDRELRQRGWLKSKSNGNWPSIFTLACVTSHPRRETAWTAKSRGCASWLEARKLTTGEPFANAFLRKLRLSPYPIEADPLVRIHGIRVTGIRDSRPRPAHRCRGFQGSARRRP
jgi:hypothetical protein